LFSSLDLWTLRVRAFIAEFCACYCVDGLWKCVCIGPNLL
jgi:hypothetical protein